MNDKKIITGFVLFIVLSLVGAVVLLGNSPSKANLEKTVGAKIETPETNFDFKDIPYSGGNAVHGFKVKNVGDKELRVANLATSCACSKVFFKSNKGESPKYSMKGMSPPSDWVGVLNPGEEGEVVAIFDPTYHGPQGVGPISRIASFETNDPDHPSVEFIFGGTVVK